MKAFIGVTDRNWFQLLPSQPSIEEVNFWQTVFLLSDVDLRHALSQLVYLPENGRIRFTIHPEARREVLKCILELNHKIHLKEVTGGLWEKKGKKVKTGVEFLISFVSFTNQKICRDYESIY